MSAGKFFITRPDYSSDDLAQYPFFRGVGERDIVEVADRARVVSHVRGEVFFNQGDAVAHQYMLLSGEVKIATISMEGEQTAMRYAGPGELFGGLLYEGLEEYPVSAVAAKNSRALRWNHSSIHKLLLAYPRLSINLISLLGREFTLIRNRFQELATERVEQRVARALSRLVDHAGKRVEKGVLIDFPVSRQDIAELTGTTLHTVSRILAKWEKMGILESGRERICICDPHGLVSLAEDLGHTG